jgi:hypothetical protein
LSKSHDAERRLQRLLLALSAEKVKFLLVGAYALAAHGYPRATMGIDIITGATGLEFESTFENSIEVHIDELALRVPSVADLICNKRASGRTRDLADVEALEQLGGADFGGGHGS